MNNYKTSDICLATVLVMEGHPISELKFDTSSRAWFLFEEENKVLKVVDVYNQRKMKVEPNKFFITLRDVKTRFYDERKRQNIRTSRVY